MTTSFLDFNRDPAEDITNTAQHYHNFSNAALRIRCYWTLPVLRDSALLASSFAAIRKADEILRKYTLSLDVKPPLGTVTAAFRSNVQKKLYSKLPAQVQPLFTTDWSPVKWIGDAVIDTAIDLANDPQVAAAGMLKFDGAIPVPAEGSPPIDPLRALHQLIEPVTEENRLIVVFVPFNGPPNGYTVLFPDWLPWVLVDPRAFDDTPVMLHEIGHACRLAHQQNEIPAQPTQEASAVYRNLMSYLNQHDRLWGWQADTIYDSYWCTGPRPSNWWVRDVRMPAGHPFLWENDN